MAIVPLLVYIFAVLTERNVTSDVGFIAGRLQCFLSHARA